MPGFELIDEQELRAVSKVFKDGGVLIAHGLDGIRKNFHVREFEEKSKEFFNVKNSLAVSSGTAAIKIALKAMGVKPGDEVITQAFNFIATIEAILDCGAKPIIANVNKTLNMDPIDAENLITKKTKVILPVHMLGVSAHMDEIMNLGKKYKVSILEDNCEAIGGKYKDKYLGAIGHAGILSFDYGKMLTTGEGGMILTNSNKLDKYCRQYHDHGHENNPKFPRGRDTKKIFGFNYRMTEMQGAIGKVQLKKLNKILKENKKRYGHLDKVISKKFITRTIPENSQGSYDTYIFFVSDKKLKNKILNHLHLAGIGTKNLPDAMEWHCSYYWEHALTKKNIKRSLKTKEILADAIAIPIWINKKEDVYKKLAKNISLIK